MALGTVEIPACLPLDVRVVIAAVFKFDPDQARDEHGRWTAIGSSGSSITREDVDSGDQGSWRFDHSFGGKLDSAWKDTVAWQLVANLKDNPTFVKLADTNTVGPIFDPRNRIYNTVDGLIRTWSETSSDHNPVSLALQLAANDVFGIPVTGVVGEVVSGAGGLADLGTSEKTKELYKEHGEALRAFVKTTYENTQKDLESLGVSHMLVYRGIEEGMDRGLQDVKMHALSSFSTSKDTAREFATQMGDNGSVMATVVPRSQIFSTPRTGPGCIDEKEVVVVGRPTQVYATSAEGSKGLDSEFLRVVLAPKPARKSLDRADQILAATLRVDLTKFDPDQARDESGKWTDEGAAGSGGAALAAYHKDLTGDLSKRLSQGRPGYSESSDAIYYLGSPMRGASSEDFKMAQHMETASDREAMLRAFGSKANWDTSWVVAAAEWDAASRLGGNGESSKATQEELTKVPLWGPRYRPLTDTELRAFDARREAMVDLARQKYGDTVTLYRGVSGRQAAKLRGVPVGGEVDLAVYSLASFTDNENSALNFTGGKKGRLGSGTVLKITVPVTDVWSMRDAGIRSVIRFSDDHGEVILLNQTKTRRAEVVWHGR